MPKVLILTASYGEGHNAAARGLKAGFERMGGCEARVVDLFGDTYGAWDRFSRKAYLWTINHAPWIWQKFYTILDRTSLLERVLFLLKPVRQALACLIEEEKPDFVGSTYPVYGFLLDRIYGGRERPFTQFTVVTDSITVNSVWFRPFTHWYVLPNEATAKVLLQAGVDEAKIQCLGFPVSPSFGELSVQRMDPAEQPRVLFMINFAQSHAPILLQKLLQIPGVEYTVTAGRNARLMSELEAVAVRSGKKVNLYGWTDQMPRLLMENHLLISKAGGATVQETLAARTPMIISQVVPGQEEGNAQLVVQEGCGVVAEGDDAILKAVEQAFSNRATCWRGYHQQLQRVSRPTAAVDIARFVLQNRVHTANT